MVLRAVHVHGWMFHERLCQGDRITGIAADAGVFDYVMGGAAVTVVTDVVAVKAAGVAEGRCPAEMTGKRPLFGKIFKVCAADKAAGLVGHGWILFWCEIKVSLP
jgi:hypothetical protein